MIEITIPGYGNLRLEHLVLDYNGTLACDGKLPDEVRERLNSLAALLRVHVITADTFGVAQAQLRAESRDVGGAESRALGGNVACDLTILPPDNQAEAKLAYVQSLGPETTVCIGNGRNDRLMLEKAALSVAVIGAEGAAVEAVTAADVVAGGILTALDMLLHPRRLVATLRS